MFRFGFDTLAIICAVLGPSVAGHFAPGSSPRAWVVAVYASAIGLAVLNWLWDYIREATFRLSRRKQQKV